MVVVLHFVGATQFASSCAKDKTRFMTMLNMTEEETKKEKDSKDELPEIAGINHIHSFNIANLIYAEKALCFLSVADNVDHQYIADRQTPPPDQLV